MTSDHIEKVHSFGFQYPQNLWFVHWERRITVAIQVENLRSINHYKSIKVIDTRQVQIQFSRLTLRNPIQDKKRSINRFEFGLPSCGFPREHMQHHLYLLPLFYWSPYLFVTEGHDETVGVSAKAFQELGCSEADFAGRHW